MMTDTVLLTAARLALPAKRPTTTISAALNSSCKILDAISGRLNNKILPSSGPWVISMVALRFTMLFSSFSVLQSAGW